MNNTHQELIAEKVAELIKKVKSINSECAFEAEEKFAYQQGFQDAIAMFYIDLTGTPKTKGTIQDTIDTVVAEERERVLEALTTTKDTTQMLQGWERYWIEVTPNRFVENCIECENTSRILKALDNTPPNKV